MRNGLPALGVKHLDACRLRVEQAMRDADHPRLQRAEDRQLGELERRAAAAAPPAEAAAAPGAPATPIVGADESDMDVGAAVAYDANGDAVMRVGPAAASLDMRAKGQTFTGAASASSLPLLPSGRFS